MNTIKSKVTVLVMLIAIVPITTLGVLNYLKTTESFTESAKDFLYTVVKSKAGELESYIHNAELAGQALAKNDAFQDYIKLVSEGESVDNFQQVKATKKAIENLLYSFQETYWGQYHHVFLIGKNKKIIISPNHGEKVKGSPSGHLNEDVSSNSWAMGALIRGTTEISDFSSWIESDHNHQMLFYPVKDAAGETQAVIGFELQIPYEKEILTKDFELGETGKIFLATLSGVPISYKGMNSAPPLRTAGFSEAQREGISSDVRLNAEGVEVIDVYLKSENHPWILVAEIESDEVLSRVNEMQRYVFIGLFLTVITAITLSIMLANFITKPIKHLTEQMAEVSVGGAEVDVAYLDRNDEIGSLARAFSRIVVSLRLVMDRYKKLKKS